MEYQIISADNGSFFISDSLTIERYGSDGLKKMEGVPSRKMFREMAYINPPIFIETDSFEEAKKMFLETTN